MPPRDGQTFFRQGVLMVATYLPNIVHVHDTSNFVSPFLKEAVAYTLLMASHISLSWKNTDSDTGSVRRVGVVT